MADRSYAALQQQMVELQKELARVKRKEERGVIHRIQRALLDYGITATQLGYASVDEPLLEEVVPKKVVAKKVMGIRPVKYRNPEDGTTWTGAGRMPYWLRDAVAGGKKLEDFLVGKFKVAAKPVEKPTPAAKAKRKGGAKTYYPASKRKPLTFGATYASPTGQRWVQGSEPMPKWMKNLYERTGDVQHLIVKS